MNGNGASAAACEASKLLSICMTGRDDDYMPDFRYRITTTLNYIARNLKRLGRLDCVELVVTDWGSEIPMAQSLPLTPEAAQICRFVYVPLAVIRTVQEDVNGFHVSLATNAGLRRACGEFVLISAADTLIPQHSLDSLLSLLEGKHGLPIDVCKTYFMLRRYQVQSSFVGRQPDLDEWDRYLLLNSSGLQSEDAALFGVSKGAGGLMMSRALWYELGGLDERLDGWGWNDIELGLRVSQRYPWLELSSVGIWLLHMEHPANGKRDSAVRHKLNPPAYSSVFRANDAAWGLGDYGIEIGPRCVAEQRPEPQSQPVSQAAEIGAWKRSSRGILAEMSSAEVRDHVTRVAGLADRTGWYIGSGDAEPLFFLSWYCMRRHPRRYMEFGLKQGLSAAAVAALCPSVEIYAAARWEGVLKGNAPKNIATALRRIAGHEGYLRFINGDITTALARLRDSFIGRFSVDLVLVRSGMFRADTLSLISGILPHLSDGGALVLTCESAEQFEGLWTRIRALIPRFTYVRSSTSGLVLAPASQDDDSGSEADEIQFDTRWIWRSRLKCQAARAYRALKTPRSYAAYVRRACQWISTKGHLGQSSRPILPR
ncbi:MAG TPA: class I SAM-dependent methyltransferase [Blastocatellia bacterium]|nr:class I SAM-dependent methyltransferase [Blastocatellia bacterium]